MKGVDDTGAALLRLEMALGRIRGETRGRATTGKLHDDADDINGSFATDDAIGFNPLPLLAVLDHYHAGAIVMGQVAGILHGSEELTGDLDLLWDGDEHHADRLAAAFAFVSATISDPEDRPIRCDTEAFRLPKVFFRTPMASGDCCTPALPWESLDIPAIIRRAKAATRSDGLCIRYVSAADLITMRRAVGRIKDLRRADELENILDG